MQNSKVIYLKPDEIDAFFKKIPPDNFRDRLIFELMLKMGLRVSEVVGDCLDYWVRDGTRIPAKEVPDEVYDRAGINVPMKYEGNEYTHIVSGTPGIFVEDIDWTEKQLIVRGKGNKIRVIPIMDDVYQLLFKFVDPINTPHSHSGRLFVKTNSHIESKISPTYIRKLCKRYGGPNCHPHKFRHTFAITYLRGGGGIRHLQRILGHSKLSVTELYLQYSEEDTRRDMEKTMSKMAKEMGGSVMSKEQATSIAAKVAKAVVEDLGYGK